MVGVYNTGHGGAYSLMLWTSRSRVHRAWLAVDEELREELHDDLSEILDE